MRRTGQRQFYLGGFFASGGSRNATAARTENGSDGENSRIFSHTAKATSMSTVVSIILAQIFRRPRSASENFVKMRNEKETWLATQLDVEELLNRWRFGARVTSSKPCNDP